MQNLIVSMVSGITPSARSRTGQQSLVLEVLCLLLDILTPKLRPVSARRSLLAALVLVAGSWVMGPLPEWLPGDWDMSPVLPCPGVG